MKKHILLSTILLNLIFFVNACTDELELVEPEFSDGSIMTNTQKIDEGIKKNIEGVYLVNANRNEYGLRAVVFFTGDTLGFYFERSGIYFLNDAGKFNSVIVTEGKWRNPKNITTGLVRTYSDTISSDSTINRFTVYYGRGGSELSEIMTLTYERPFSSKVKSSNFYILAHRGGGRNSDYLGVSENSLEMIERAEYYGANGIEIDIKISKDNIPFLYHDTEVNQRLLQPTTVIGPIEEFSFPQLKSFFKLRNGEQIPSLVEALDYVIEETNLKLVWLDMKSDKPSVELVAKIQREKLIKASQMGRDLKILMGVPSQKIYDDLIRFPNYQNIPTLCELDVNLVRNLDSKVWAPRWSEGTQMDLVQQMHAEGRLAFTWTLDQFANIRTFINESGFDGILTNYPTIVTFYYYVQQ